MITETEKVISSLSSEEAQVRLAQFGKNEIIRKEKINPWQVLLKQFTSPLILILLAAAALSFALGYLPGQASHNLDAILILIIVLLSGFFGFFQDYRAEKTIEALQEMTTPHARVIRDDTE